MALRKPPHPEPPRLGGESKDATISPQQIPHRGPVPLHRLEMIFDGAAGDAFVVVAVVDVVEGHVGDAGGFPGGELRPPASYGVTATGRRLFRYWRWRWVVPVDKCG